VDDGTKVVTTVEAMPGANQVGAAGTGTFVDPQGLALPGTQLPVVQTFVSGAVIEGIDVDNGAGEAVIQLAAATDLSLVLAGDFIVLSGAADIAHDNTFEISSVNDGADTVNLTTTLSGVDQVSTAGTADITGERLAADGTALVRIESQVTNYDSPIVGAAGSKFYADSSDPEGYSKTSGNWRIGWQTTPLQMLVSIEEEGAANQIVSGSGTPEGAVTASVGTVYLRTDGGAGTTLYVKESGVGNTGWVSK